MIKKFRKVSDSDLSLLEDRLKQNEPLFWNSGILLLSFFNTQANELYLCGDMLIGTKAFKDSREIRGLFRRTKPDIEGRLSCNGAFGYLYLWEGNIGPDDQEVKERQEYIYVLERLVRMEGSNYANVRSSYNYFRSHFEVSVVDIREVSIDVISNFLQQWSLEVKKHDFSKEIYLLMRFGKLDKVIGSVLFFEGKVIGLEVSVENASASNYHNNILRKVLRSFKRGNEYLQVEHAKRLLERGVKFINDGAEASENGFKSKFLDIDSPRLLRRSCMLSNGKGISDLYFPY